MSGPAPGPSSCTTLSVARFLPSTTNSALGLTRARLLWPLLTSSCAALGLPTWIAALGTPEYLPMYDAPAFTLMPAAFTPTTSVQTLDFRDRASLSGVFACAVFIHQASGLRCTSFPPQLAPQRLSFD